MQTTVFDELKSFLTVKQSKSFILTAQDHRNLASQKDTSENCQIHLPPTISGVIRQSIGLRGKRKFFQIKKNSILVCLCDAFVDIIFPYQWQGLRRIYA